MLEPFTPSFFMIPHDQELRPWTLLINHF
ncbi:hypothetical protein CCP2SC5_10020 [Azospirillaceae bacterium]